MATQSVQIYAELLPNIRQVSVSATLPAVDASDSSSSSAEVLADGVTLRVRWTGAATTELRLPGRVAAAGTRLRLPSASASSTSPGDRLRASWRLPLAGSSSPSAAAATTPGLAPWSAPDLQTGVAVACRACAAAVVAAGRISAWKDLPSDNWAEMMEFWHCHKPDDHDHGHGHDHDHGHGHDHDHRDALAARGYGANSAIRAQAGIGFVDLIALLFAESDCRGVVFSRSTYDAGSPDREAIEPPKKALQSLNVFCAGCRAQIGYFNMRMLAVTLFKWQVQCGGGGNLPSVSDCLAAALVATVARSGSSKSLILPIYDLPALAPAPAPAAEPASEPAPVLHIWVLNSNIRYAASGQDAPVLAIKLLYRFVSRATADAMLETLSSDVQEINLPDDTIRTVTAQLAASNAVLPDKEKQFKEWRIGLLARWED